MIPMSISIQKLKLWEREGIFHFRIVHIIKQYALHSSMYGIVHRLHI